MNFKVYTFNIYLGSLKTFYGSLLSDAGASSTWLGITFILRHDESLSSVPSSHTNSYCRHKLLAWYWQFLNIALSSLLCVFPRSRSRSYQKLHKHWAFHLYQWETFLVMVTQALPSQAHLSLPPYPSVAPLYTPKCPLVEYTSFLIPINKRLSGNLVNRCNYK